MKFERWCIHWGGPESDWWYLGIASLEKGARYLGRYSIWYDGPHNGLGFWFFAITWQTDWMKCDESKLFKQPRFKDWYNPSYGHLRKK